jgi:hypothetical protein
MGLRQRLETQLRDTLRQAARHGGRINRTGRSNVIVVHNSGPGTTAASARQDAPIIQDGRRTGTDETGRTDTSST